MVSKKLNTVFPSIHSLEEYEQLKLETEIFENAAKEIIHQHQLPDEPLTLLEGTNVVFFFGKNRIIKIFPPLHQDHCKTEVLVMRHLQNKLTVNTPAIEYEGEIAGWPYIIMSRLEGTLLEGLWEKLDENNKLVIIRELGSLIREVHSLSTHGLESIDSHWEKFIKKQINQCVTRHQSTKLSDTLIQQIPTYLESAETILPKIKKPVLLTGEYTPMNCLVREKLGVWHINGLIDFGDCMLGLPEYDLLGPAAFLIQGDKKLSKEFLLSYGYTSKELTNELSHQLTVLMLLHRYSNLNIQIRIKNWKDTVCNLNELENLIWGF